MYTTRNVSDRFCIMILSLGIVGMGYSIISLIRIHIANKYFRFLFIVYIFDNFIILIQAFKNMDFARLLSFITDPYLFFPYVIPIVALIPANVFFLKKIFDYFALLGLVLIVLFLILAGYMLNVNSFFSEHVMWTLGAGCGFMLLTIDYQSYHRKIIAVVAVFLSLFISTVLARRNIMLTFSNYILFSILLLLFNSKKSISFKILFLSIVLSSFLGAYFIFDKYQDNLFARISGRLDENTREQIFSGFFTSMSKNDLILGKGFEGTYYAPTIEEDKDNRSIIECGYLQTILKGGIINLSLFLFIALPAAYLGMIKSHNAISRAAAAIIILWLVDMVPWGMPALNIRYIFLWICIGLCYSGEMQVLSDADIKNSLKLFSR